MEGKDVLAIQEILFSLGFLNERPSEVWSAAAVSGYSTYLQSLGVPYPQNTMLPGKMADTPKDLQRYVELKNSIRFTTNGE